MPEILRYFDQIWSFSTDFHTRPPAPLPSIKFYGNLFNVSRAETCGQGTDEDVKQQIATMQTRLQLFSKQINACRSSEFVTQKYGETQVFAYNFRPTVCRN